jgi:dTDP-4-amino-4,6-dideoxygalactose transaminase
MKIDFARPFIGEEEKNAVCSVLDRPRLTEGPETESFEKEFARWCGGGHAVAVSSCTAALHLSMMALDLKPGDEVIVPAMTHVATVHPVFISRRSRSGSLKRRSGSSWFTFLAHHAT